MKKILCLIILPILFLTGCSKNENKPVFDKIIENDSLTVGVKTDAKPFGFINETTGENDGFDIDIAKYIARDILGTDKNIKYVSVNSNTRIESVTSGNVDMVIATMSITPQRQYLIDFSVPYYIASQTAVVKKDSDIYTFSDLRNKTTIIVMGTTAEKNLRRIVPTAKIIGYKTYDEAFSAFIQGKGEALITDDTILSDFIYKNKGYRMLKSKLSQEPYAVGMMKEEDNDKLKQSVDIVITRMLKDGTIKYLEKKWKLK